MRSWNIRMSRTRACTSSSRCDPATEVAKKFDKPVYFLVWTTTPWTLPANLAIAVGPEVQYAFVEYTRDGERRVGIVAEELRERVFELAKDVDDVKLLERVDDRRRTGRAGGISCIRSSSTRAASSRPTMSRPPTAPAWFTPRRGMAKTTTTPACGTG